jgi:type VI secretion system protein ImpH
MAAASDLPLDQRLFDEPYVFEFFQAVRLLRRLADDRGILDSRAEVVRFRTLPTLNFPPSAVADLERGTTDRPPRMTVAFLGLTGPSGVLPRHYTELVMRLAREAKGEERHALRDWLDLFSHRFIALFYRAWEHYRFVPVFERGEAERSDPDAFTQGLYSLIGLGTRGLRKRLKVAVPATADWPEKVLRSVDDLGLLRFGGLLAQQHRNAWGLQALLAGYFGASVEICQFRGQWLPLEVQNQTQFGDDGNCALGSTAVAGDRIWDVQGKILVRLGPMRYSQFIEFLPDRSPVPERKAMFLLSQLIKLYAGPELDADVQLVLMAEDVPQCQLNDDPKLGPRLGWNCWTLSGAAASDSDDAVFEAEAVVRLKA